MSGYLNNFMPTSTARKFGHGVAGLVLCLSFFPSCYASSNPSCSTALSERAVLSLNEHGDTWAALRRHQKAFAVCDDGVLAEGYSDAVSRLFARRWHYLGEFAAIARKDPAFAKWAIKHVDASAAVEDLRRIVTNAKKCSGGVQTKNLCAAIEQAASNALAEQADTSPVPGAS